MFCKECGTENSDITLKCINCGTEIKKNTQANNKSKIFLFTIAIVVLIVSLIPFAVSKYTDVVIEQNKVYLKDLGVDFDVYSNIGYVISNRSISIKINNGRYFANHIFKLLKKSIPEYKTTLEKIFYEQGIDWELLLNGIELKGDLVVNNFLLDNPTLTISLKELSKDIMSEIKLDRDASKIILPLLDKEILGGKIEFNKAGQFINIKLKDIDESVKENKKRVTIQFLQPKYLLSNETKDIYSFSRFYTSIKDKNDLINMQLDNLEFVNEAHDSININSKLDIKNILFLINNKKNFKFSMKNLNVANQIKPFDKKVNVVHSFTTNNTNLSFNDKKISFKNLDLNFNISNLDKKSLSRVVNDYTEKEFDIDKYSKIEVDNLFHLINNGMNIKFYTEVKNLDTPETKSSNFSLDFDIKIIENELTQDNMSIEKLISNLDITAELKIDETTALKLIELDKIFKNYFDLSINKNGYNIFQLKIKDTKMSVNNIDSSLLAEVIGDIHFEKENYDTAIKFYNYAVENGNDSANFRLGYSYNKIKEYDNAIQSYKSYIKHKPYEGAMYNLAQIYLLDKKDYKMAISWYKLALSKKYKYGHIEIAYCYEALKDYKNAEKWYRKTLDIDENNKDAMHGLADVFRYGLKNYTKAIKWYKKAIDNGYDDNYFGIAYCYGALNDYKNAEKWYKKDLVKNKNSENSSWNLALIYEYGKGKISVNKRKAFDLYYKLVKKSENIESMNKVAYMYRDGEGTYKNYRKAIKWYKKAIDNGYDSSYFGIAYCYDKLKEYKNAEKWYKKSISQGEPVAMWNLGLIYESGRGNIKKDINKAMQMYEKASKLGDKDAAKRIKYLKSIQEEEKKVALKINVSPYDAKIRILNIKEKYHFGIKLKKSSYHINVSKKGYTTYDKWVTLSKDEQYTIELKKLIPKKEKSNSSTFTNHSNYTSVNLGACKGCHGANFEKKALGKSKIVKDMTKQEVSDALVGYKNGTYGGPMKGVMKGQVAKYSNYKLRSTGLGR